jgi:hypothetical protein
MTRINLFALMFLSLALSLATPHAAQAAESYANCAGFITTLPATISTAGTWCFNQNLSTSITNGTAITITSDNVVLDCNDFKLDGLAAGVSTSTQGISTSGSLNNVTVRRCNIRGFFLGISLCCSNQTAEDNRFDDNTAIGMVVQGDGSVIRRNRVFDTGGSTVANYAWGISTFFNVDIEDNTVSGAVATSGNNGEAIGIRTSQNSGSTIRSNRMRGLAKDGTGKAFGIYNTLSDRLVMRDNDLVGDTSAGSQGLTCTNSNGRAKDNTIKGFVTGITTCSNDGGNVIKP